LLESAPSPPLGRSRSPNKGEGARQKEAMPHCLHRAMRLIPTEIPRGGCCRFLPNTTRIFCLAPGVLNGGRRVGGYPTGSGNKMGPLGVGAVQDSTTRSSSTGPRISQWGSTPCAAVACRSLYLVLDVGSRLRWSSTPRNYRAVRAVNLLTS
jgi:hypothetical protein